MLIHLNSSFIDHDCIVGCWCHIVVGTHLSGTVKDGECCWIGVGTTISNNLIVCSNMTIGARAIVVNDINESGTYVGVPAKLVKGNRGKISDTGSG